MVVDGRGRCVGVVTLNMIAALLAVPAGAPQPLPAGPDAGGSLVRGGGVRAEGVRDSE